MRALSSSLARATVIHGIWWHPGRCACLGCSSCVLCRSSGLVRHQPRFLLVSIMCACPPRKPQLSPPPPTPSCLQAISMHGCTTCDRKQSRRRLGAAAAGVQRAAHRLASGSAPIRFSQCMCVLTSRCPVCARCLPQHDPLPIMVACNAASSERTPWQQAVCPPSSAGNAAAQVGCRPGV